MCRVLLAVSYNTLLIMGCSDWGWSHCLPIETARRVLRRHDLLAWPCIDWLLFIFFNELQQGLNVLWMRLLLLGSPVLVFHIPSVHLVVHEQLVQRQIRPSNHSLLQVQMLGHVEARIESFAEGFDLLEILRLEQRRLKCVKKRAQLTFSWRLFLTSKSLRN